MMATVASNAEFEIKDDSTDANETEELRISSSNMKIDSNTPGTFGSCPAKIETHFKVEVDDDGNVTVITDSDEEDKEVDVDFIGKETLFDIDYK